MAWVGVPFPFHFVNGAEAIVIDKLPEIALNTPFAWETIISSFIAGAIPALIAWKALSKNFEIARFQMRVTEQKDMADKLRLAALDFVSSVDKIAQLSHRLINTPGISIDSLAKGKFPDYYQEALNDAQRSMRNLHFLIRPDEAGMKLLSYLPSLQQSLKPFFTFENLTGQEALLLKEKIDDFIFHFHEYINTFRE
ncbi:hypothetical protein OR233_001666 [Enterobacter asburiae]|nr:hypothetical protein [Enterobacter asburiae]